MGAGLSLRGAVQEGRRGLPPWRLWKSERVPDIRSKSTCCRLSHACEILRGRPFAQRPIWVMSKEVVW